jgi:uncharacterized protein YqgC (DUF456 family)
MDTTVLLWVLAAILVIAGIVGLVIPTLPGALLVLAGLVVAAWAEDFAYVGAGTITILILLTVIAYAVDFLSSALGAKHFGASKRSIIGATLGAFIGLLFFGLPGVLIGPFLGGVLGGLSGRQDLQAAGRAGMGASIGVVLGAVAKLAIVFSMLGVFALARFL